MEILILMHYPIRFFRQGLERRIQVLSERD